MLYTVIDSKWAVLTKIYGVIPQKGSLMYIGDSYREVLNVIHRPKPRLLWFNTSEVFVVVE